LRLGTKFTEEDKLQLESADGVREVPWEFLTIVSSIIKKIQAANNLVKSDN
jgi:hypothetical protein